MGKSALHLAVKRFRSIVRAWAMYLLSLLLCDIGIRISHTVVRTVMTLLCVLYLYYAFLRAVINFLIMNYKVMKIIFTKSAMLSPDLRRGFNGFQSLFTYVVLFYFQKNEYEKNQSYEILDSILYPDLA